jgi:hypothetical protein
MAGGGLSPSCPGARDLSPPPAGPLRRAAALLGDGSCLEHSCHSGSCDFRALTARPGAARGSPPPPHLRVPGGAGPPPAAGAAPPPAHLHTAAAPPGAAKATCPCPPWAGSARAAADPAGNRGRGSGVGRGGDPDAGAGGGWRETRPRRWPQGAAPFTPHAGAIHVGELGTAGPSSGHCEPLTCPTAPCPHCFWSPCCPCVSHAVGQDSEPAVHLLSSVTCLFLGQAGLGHISG